MCRGKRTVSGIVPLTSDLESICVCPCRLELQMCTTVDNFFFFKNMGSKDQTTVQAKHFSNEVNCSNCFMLVLELLPQAIFFLFFFLKIYLFIICKYIVAVFKGIRSLLQVVVSHHVVAGI